MKKFALTGLAGFIAPRHLRAIKDTGNQLVAAMDKNDSVGVIDSFFPSAEFFTKDADFAQFIATAQKSPTTKIDYLTVCTPNHIHKPNIELGFANGIKVICEKPLVVNPKDLESLKASGDDLFTILQLRLHPQLIELKKNIAAAKPTKKYSVDLSYITSRGNWYDKSWKADDTKSGGVVANIGIHFYDMLMWIFGNVQNQKVHLLEPKRAAGVIELENAQVRWFLSIDENDLPENAKSAGKRTFRSITVDGSEIEFSDGFMDLHTKSYEEILAGRGFTLRHAMPAIELVNQIRTGQVSSPRGEYHPFVRISP